MARPSFHDRREQGFTIIELMIVLVIAAIIAAIAIPSFRANIANQRNKAAAQQLLLSLQQARDEARKFNGACTVAFVPADSSDFAAGWSVVAYNPGTTDDECEIDLDLDGSDETVGTSVDGNNDGDTSDLGEDSTLQHTNALDGVGIAPSAATAKIVYNRSGRVTEPSNVSALSITVCDDNNLGFKRTLSIDISGAPSIERGAVCP